MRKSFIISAMAVVFAACGQKVAEPVPFEVVPQPMEVSLGQGAFKVVPEFNIEESVPAEAAERIAEFQQRISQATGKKARAGEAFDFYADPTLGPEEYAIDITAERVIVRAATYNGFIFAIQTLKQMMPVEIYGTGRIKGGIALQEASIKDAPRFAYRGMHLDPCRHFWSIDEVKKYLDIMAVYKLNRFHWHLTEDQGWRMEIKKYPKLTEVGAWRNGTVIRKNWDTNDGIRYGGFYTQEEMREVVAYAAKLGITVIPEIDLPGHMVAALTAYPELGCTGGPYEVWTRWGVSEEVLCVGKEETFTFLENVLTEVMDIFPSEYIHIGGDECPKTRWAECPLCQARMKELGIREKNPVKAGQLLQNYVTARIQKFLADHGRKVIGWDEILEGELAPGATIMSWRGTQGGIQAAKSDMDAIMTPSSDGLYFDHYQTRELDKEPFGIGGYAPIDKVYSYDPYNGVPEEAQHHILGVQANLWTEYIATPEHLEYMLLPRLAALSEVQWCQVGDKDYGRFSKAMDRQASLYEFLGYTYCRAFWGETGLAGVEPAEPAAEN